MIFEALWASAQRGELILVEGGYCRYRVRRDGQLTICEIIVLPAYQHRGVGRTIIAGLGEVARKRNCTSILAKCPADLAANGFYEHLGFSQEAIEHTRTGRAINVWRLAC